MNEDRRENSKKVYWNCIVITCYDPKWRDHIEKEVNRLSRAGFLPPHSLLLVVDDPQVSKLSIISNLKCRGVGSGGATLNALLIVAERLSALAGDTTIDSDVLSKNLILMVHFGRSSFHYPGGNAFLPIDQTSSWVPPSLCLATAPILLQNAMWMASSLAADSLTGVWITSVDFYIPYSSTASIPSTATLDGALVCSLEPDNLLNQSGQHGFLQCDAEGKLRNIAYKRVPLSKENTEGGREGLICSCCFLSSSLAGRMLSLYTQPPLDRCTYYGTDSASFAVQVSLYFDLLLPLCSETEEEKYLSGLLSYDYAKRAEYSTLMHQEGLRARHSIWNQLRPYAASDHRLDIGGALYLNPSLPFSKTVQPLLTSFQRSLLDIVDTPNTILFNSRFGVRSLSNRKSQSHLTALNCNLGEGVHFEAGEKCVLFDLQLKEPFQLYLESGIVWQCWPLNIGGKRLDIISCHGFDDHLEVERTSKSFSIFNTSWDKFVSSLCPAIGDVCPEDLWDGDQVQTLAKAKLFPCDLPVKEQLMMLEAIISSGSGTKGILKGWKARPRKSFEDLLVYLDVERLMKKRQDAFLAAVKQLIEATSRDSVGPCLSPVFQLVTATSIEMTLDLLQIFHRVLQGLSPISSRLLANVADLLGCLGGAKGGLRSGPAANEKWLPALQDLKRGNYNDGINRLEAVCREFIQNRRPDDIIRASRHYERASHILISKQVETAREEVWPLSRKEGGGALSKGVWVEATCPARLDLAGGWTDTPPVCYELGGAVLNVAIKVNGERPIGAKARFSSSLDLTCVLRDASGSELRLVWDTLAQLQDYDNPVSPGALVKACLVYAQFVDHLDERATLQEQLKHRYGGGLELVVWSDLAHGSGLGGSSLLAGTVLGVLFVLMGFESPSMHKLIHATLGVEQMLTTGGGWQDQVGGLIGGMKLGLSEPCIPLVVSSYTVPLEEDFLQFLNDRLILIYTGKVRLARNLLQTVLRNWYAKEDRVTSCFSKLLALALEAASAALDRNGARLGTCIDHYWELKKKVASGCEPTEVGLLMSGLRSCTLGQSLAGAGGGGYMYGLTSLPKDQSIQGHVSTQYKGMRFDPVQIDTEGLKISVDGQVVFTAGFEGEKLTPEILQRVKLQFGESC